MLRETMIYIVLIHSYVIAHFPSLQSTSHIPVHLVGLVCAIQLLEPPVGTQSPT